MKAINRMFVFGLFMLVFSTFGHAQEGGNLLEQMLNSESFTSGQRVKPDIYNGEDENGPWLITLKRQNFKSLKIGEAFLYNMKFSQKGKSDTYTFAESEEAVYRVEGGRVKKELKKGKKPNWTAINACLQNFLTSGGVAKCTACYNSLKSCNGQTPWYVYIACIVPKLGTAACKSCGASVSTLVKCLKNAW